MDQLIHPPEYVQVDITHLAHLIREIRTATYDRTPIRPEVHLSTVLVANVATAQMRGGATVVEVPAEPLWWLTHGAEQSGHARYEAAVFGCPRAAALFTAVDAVGHLLDTTARRTSQGMHTLLDAEVVMAVAEDTIHRGDGSTQ